MALLECNSLAIGYSGKPVCENIGFKLSEGDHIFILGENGSGKSTLLKTILGLNKPISGNISFDKGIKKSGIGYLAQMTEARRDFPATVKEVVLSGRLGMHRSPFYTAADRAAAQECMERLGISGLEDRHISALSGGQRQRVMLCRALVSSPRLLILDEPTTALDSAISHDLLEICEELRAGGLALITVSHELDAAQKYATHILHLAQRQRFFGTLADYQKSDLGSSYLKEAGRNA